MARKITIRRVGTIFPALCLVVIVVITTCLAWLSIAGLPQWVLRRVEQQVAPYGVQLKLGDVKLALSSGLAFKVEDTRLSMPMGEAETAELSFRKLLVDFNIYELAAGQLMPSDVQLIDAGIELPLLTEANDKLSVRELNTGIHFYNKGSLAGITCTGLLQGIRVQLRTEVALPDQALHAENTESAQAEAQTKQQHIELDKLIEPVRPYLLKAHQEIARQQWTEKQQPRLDVLLRLRDKSPEAIINAEIPTYEIGQLLFRDAELKLTIDRDSYIIDRLSFRTEKPASKVSIKGGYDKALRQLSFTAESTAAIIQMARLYYGEEPESILSRIYPNSTTPPHIILRGNIDFAEDFALNSLTLRGSIDQKKLNIGSTHVNSLQLSFFLSDGNFNIDKLKISLPDGELEANASSAEGQGKASIAANMPVETLLQLISDISGQPVFLPHTMNAHGIIHLKAAANMAVNEFVPGKTRMIDLVPELRSLELQLGVDALRFGQVTLTHPGLTLKLEDVHHPMPGRESFSIGSTQISAAVDKLQTTNGETIETVQLSAQIHEASLDALQDWQHSLLLRRAEVSATAATLRHSEGCMQGMVFSLTDIHNFTPQHSWQQLLAGTRGQFSIADITRHDGTLSLHEAQLLIHPTKDGKGSIDASIRIGDKELRTALALDYARTEQTGELGFALQRTEIPLGAFVPLLETMGGKMTALEYPEKVIISTDGSVNINTGHMGKTQVTLELPELVRTPNTLAVNRGIRIPLQLKLDGQLEHNEQGELLYDAALTVGHGNTAFRGSVNGNLDHFCRIKGNSDIRVDVINRLIDDVDAHSIMRDFRFDASSATRITDIDAMIRYTQGIDVNVTCNAQILNTDFLIGAIEDIYDSKGEIVGEKLRTDMGKNPYSRVFEATCGVQVKVQMDCLNERGEAIPDDMSVTLTSPYLRYDNRPWLKRMNITNGVRSSEIKGESIVFDLNHNGIVLNHLKGQCYPAYAFGMYFAPLQEFMSDIEMQKPAKVHTQRCEFPISHNSQVPISGLIRAEAASGAALHFLGTRIPMNHFSGFVNLSDDYVFLDKLNAATWEGVLNGAVKIGISGPRTSFDGQITASNVNLKEIAAAYKTTLSPALCNGHIRFRAESPELNDLQAYGSVTVSDGDLLQLGIFQPVGSFINDIPGYLLRLQNMVTGTGEANSATAAKKEEEETGFFSTLLRTIFRTTDDTINSVDSSTQHIPFANHFMRYNIQNAAANFEIKDGFLFSRDMRATGYNLDVDMKLRLNLDTLELRGNLWPRISSVPTLFIAPITFLSEYLIDIVIYGPVDNIQWKFTLDRIMSGKKTRPSVTAKGEDKQEKQ